METAKISIIISFFLFVFIAINFAADYNGSQDKVLPHEHPVFSLGQFNILKAQTNHTHENFTDSQHLILDQHLGDAKAELKLYVHEEITRKLDTPEPTPEPEPQPEEPEFTLTISLTSTTLLAGETLTFEGTAQPNNAVFVTVKTPDRTITGATVTGDSGKYLIDIPTEFNDAFGVWQAWAHQEDEKSRTIGFSIVDRLES